LLIKIFIVEDDQTFSKLTLNTLKSNNQYEISLLVSGAECLKKLHLNPDIVLLDFGLPDISGLELMQKINKYDASINCVIISGQTDIDVVVKAYRLGASDYIIKNENCFPEIENSVKNLAANVELRHEVETLKEQIIDRTKYQQILGNSPSILKVLKLIQKAEKKDIMILITGESGTGKELVARALHYNSERPKAAFVPINMSAIPKDLLESELFGHEKGAFTGAISKRIGKFEEANNGTVFLDEIGEMDPSLQSKLLRILEDKQVTRIGNNKAINLNIRIIAASNKNLMEEVKKGNFRKDLYYRIHGYLIDLPNLRERGDDIILLAKHFLNAFAKENKLNDIHFDKEAIKLIQSYHWPGNVRELRSVVERAALIIDSNIITPDALGLDDALGNLDFDSGEFTLEEYKVKIIAAYLKKYNNDVDLVAQKLQIGRATIYRVRKKFQHENVYFGKN